MGNRSAFSDETTGFLIQETDRRFIFAVKALDAQNCGCKKEEAREYPAYAAGMLAL